MYQYVFGMNWYIFISSESSAIQIVLNTNGMYSIHTVCIENAHQSIHDLFASIGMDWFGFVCIIDNMHLF